MIHLNQVAFVTLFYALSDDCVSQQHRWRGGGVKGPSHGMLLVCLGFTAEVEHKIIYFPQQASLIILHLNAAFVYFVFIH